LYFPAKQRFYWRISQISHLSLRNILQLFGFQSLNYCVTHLLRGEHHHGHGREPVDQIYSSSCKSKHRTTTTNSIKKDDDDEDEDEGRVTTAEVAAKAVAPCACCSDSPVEDLENIRQMALACEEKEETKQPKGDDNSQDSLRPDSYGNSTDDNVNGDIETPSSNNSANDDREDENKQNSHQSHDAKLMRMSINTAIAIGLHNFPEGLATFVATLNDPKVGGVLGLAIAIHNIPEGLCVAMPVYYATGKRWKAFAWGIISGISEPIAAVLGYAVLANSFSDVIYAVLFGLVAGMMVVISTRELLPTAHRYDPEDTVVTYSFIAGMGIMALSLVLFQL
jgi:ZIP family zinc transporter